MNREIAKLTVIILLLTTFGLGVAIPEHRAVLSWVSGFEAGILVAMFDVDDWN